MAWAERLPSGRWRGVYRDATGRRRSAGTFPHKAAATRTAAAEEERVRRSHTDVDGAKRTWADWCQEWWPTRGVEASTLHADQGRRRNHVEPRWGHIRLGAIRREDVRAWAVQLGQEKGLAPQTVQHCVRLLSSSLAAAVDKGLLEVNPVAGLKLPTAPPAVERFLTPEEYAAVWEQLPTVRDRLIADVLVSTGLRWGELAGLHRHRLLVDRGEVAVVEAYSERSGQVKPYPKGRRPREVPVPGWLLEQLQALPATGESCGLVHTQGRCRSGLLVVSSRGGVLRHSNWSDRVWVGAVKAAGVGHVRVHDLRHTYASWLLQGGVSLAEVGRLLGHVSPVTTQRYSFLARTPADVVLRVLGERVVPRLPHGDGGS